MSAAATQQNLAAEVLTMASLACRALSAMYHAISRTIHVVLQKDK